ncbi:DNA binding protein [Spizellomyces punctatus DAOM BR117]|uniref:DNA binding protein n=1 Tax=Spizellomyces punctatus (strain DAOM BR117) TaxID=645134 RepID=A0A0L0HME1_SPIPD|nr:DNA binding protein [Spizellomyces punctatus DAOM BR117]KND02070.1 DNA binding protein [Spizellomyces punctatus DAOM BR117]|eukprot:XP_016610109.1 DNA binding protein [Spizellomyces punctatus DAOM BR117]
MSSSPSRTHGNMESAKGAVKENVGKVLGNQSMRVEGASQRAAGNAEVEAVKTANYADGQMDSMGGSIKKNVGSAIGNERMQASGAQTEAAGEMKKAANQ